MMYIFLHPNIYVPKYYHGSLKILSEYFLSK